MRAGTVQVSDFSDNSLAKLLTSSGIAVKYLYGYLSALDAQSIIIETHYVDRHYLDEFSHYYSKSFSTPAAHCARFHFFGGLSAQKLSGMLAESYAGKASRTSVEELLQKHYLGFVVRRPLSAATVGRTVLKTYPVEGRRHYSVLRPYLVNIAGIRLVVEGLAYQQQDRGAAVCASTALWTALQRVAYVDGNRTPTPSAITRAARSPYPVSYGLGPDQMASALDTLGYIAEALVPLDNRALFRAQVVSYLNSHLPVILQISTKKNTGAGGQVTIGHAVTITGYSETSGIVDVIPHMRSDVLPIRMAAGALDTIYVHDDNLGSHAHYELFDSDDVNEHGHKKLVLRRGHLADLSVDWWTPDEWQVDGALVPKPSKLRLPISSLFDALLWIRPAFQMLVFPGLDLNFKVRFESGVLYRRSLMDLPIDFAQLQDFQYALSLPRHIGVLSAYSGDDHLCDVVVDVSEIDRNPDEPSLLAFVAPGVPLMSQAHMNLSQVGNMLKCPLLTGPATIVTTFSTVSETVELEGALATADAEDV